MMQSYMENVKNIEATEREQHMMREKLAQRKLELEKKEQALANEHEQIQVLK